MTYYCTSSISTTSTRTVRYRYQYNYLSNHTIKLEYNKTKVLHFQWFYFSMYMVPKFIYEIQRSLNNSKKGITIFFNPEVNSQQNKYQSIYMCEYMRACVRVYVSVDVVCHFHSSIIVSHPDTFSRCGSAGRLHDTLLFRKGSCLCTDDFDTSEASDR